LPAYPQSTTSFPGGINIPNATGTVLASISDAGAMSVPSLVNTGTTTGIKRVVEAHTAGDTLTAAESGSIHTNEGASGAVTLVLPAAVVGLEFGFHVAAAQELRIDPNGTETTNKALGAAQEAAGKYITADADMEFIYLRCVKAGRWEAVAIVGTWGVQA
jgi:hypothetical protein